jgi:hypothetical protein
MKRLKRIHYDPSNDLYIVLGVQPSATPDELRRSFRQRAKEVHPDRNPDKSGWAHEQFEHLNDAYDILSDTTRRAEYDEKRQRYQRQRGPDGIAWWERPNPATAPRSSPENERPRYAPPVTPKHRRQPIYEVIYGRKNVYRPYQFLLIVSSMILFVSLCATLTNPVRVILPGMTENSTLAEGSQPLQPAQSAEPTATGQLSCSNPEATITEPTSDTEVSGRFQVRGTADDPHFRSYVVEIGPFVPPPPGTDTRPTWAPTITHQSTTPVKQGALLPALSADGFAPGSYLIRLTVSLDDGTTLTPCEVRFHRRIAF